ncbi:hypothetical protein NBRC116594_09660 [Shimia sp. NS0008-38b]
MNNRNESGQSGSKYGWHIGPPNRNAKQHCAVSISVHLPKTMKESPTNEGPPDCKEQGPDGIHGLVHSARQPTGEHINHDVAFGELTKR